MLPGITGLPFFHPRLECEERELSAVRRKLHDGFASFANPLNEARAILPS
jgi:hypothetical protein